MHTKKMPGKIVGAMSVQRLIANGNTFEVTKIILDGQNHRVTKFESDCAYYILEGKGSFIIYDEPHDVEATDLLFIPKGTPYSNNGRMTLLVIDSPKLDFDKVDVS